MQVNLVVSWFARAGLIMSSATVHTHILPDDGATYQRILLTVMQLGLRCHNDDSKNEDKHVDNKDNISSGSSTRQLAFIFGNVRTMHTTPRLQLRQAHVQDRTN